MDILSFFLQEKSAEAQSRRECPLLRLPPELKLYIFDYLSIYAINALAATCKDIHYLREEYEYSAMFASVIKESPDLEYALAYTHLSILPPERLYNLSAPELEQALNAASNRRDSASIKAAINTNKLACALVKKALKLSHYNQLIPFFSSLPRSQWYAREQRRLYAMLLYRDFKEDLTTNEITGETGVLQVLCNWFDVGTLTPLQARSNSTNSWDCSTYLERAALSAWLSRRYQSDTRYRLFCKVEKLVSKGSLRQIYDVVCMQYRLDWFFDAFELEIAATLRTEGRKAIKIPALCSEIGRVVMGKFRELDG